MNKTHSKAELLVWLSKQTGLKPNTVKVYLWSRGHLQKPAMQKVVNGRVHNLYTHEQAESFLAALSQKGDSNGK